ncbi:MAG: hypothetical protein V1872_06900 [bacterium]
MSETLVYKDSKQLVLRITCLSIIILTTVYLYSIYRPYFSIAEGLRHHSEAMHKLLKPSGRIGHVLGIVGGLLMMLSYALYFVRKKAESLEDLGNLSLWLDIHIFLGLLGPVLIIFHSALRFNGLIGLAFWIMIIVVISGIFGRLFFGIFFYRITQKYELLHTIDLLIEKELRGEEIKSSLIQRVVEIDPPQFPPHNSLKETFKQWMSIKRETKDIFTLIDERYNDYQASDHYELQTWSDDLIKRLLEIRSVSLLNIYLAIISKWVIVHKVFSYILFFIMFLHAFVTIYWGYIPFRR